MKAYEFDDASRVYEKTLALDDQLYNVWFNLAHAQLGAYTGAMASLNRTLAIEPGVAAARHMYKALSDEDAEYVVELEDEYVKELFNTYGSVYDDQLKKLRYSAPRVIRQEMAKVYKAIYEKDRGVTISGDRDFNVAGEQIKADGCSTYTVFMNASLDILDLGCGTGLAGAWLKDYARSMVGVDISEGMVAAAGRKMLYQELHINSIVEYLSSTKKTFDLVVAAEVLAYIGDISDTFKQVTSVMRPNSYFVFTAESCGEDATEKGFKLLKNGRFGYSRSYLEATIASLGPSFSIVRNIDFPRVWRWERRCRGFSSFFTDLRSCLCPHFYVSVVRSLNTVAWLAALSAYHDF